MKISNLTSKDSSSNQNLKSVFSTNSQIQNITLNLPLLLLIISYILISFGQLQRIQLGHHVAFYAHDIFISLFVLAAAIEYRASVIDFMTSLWQKPYVKWGLIFLAWSGLGLITKQAVTDFNYLPWLYWLRLITYLAAGLFLQLVIRCQKHSQSWLMLIYKIHLVLILAIGFFQYFFVPDLSFLLQQGWDPHLYRLAGSMLDPNFLGIILSMNLIVWLFKIAANNNQRLGLGIILILGLLLTYSRSSYGAFLLMSGLIWFLTSRQTKQQRIRRCLLFLVIIFICFIPFLPQPGGLGVQLRRTETVKSRTDVNRQVMREITFDEFLFGQGLFTPNINLEQTNQIVHAKFPDNLLIFILSGSGLVGLSIFGYSFYLLCQELYQKSHLVSLTLVAGVAAHAMFNLSLLEPIILLLLLFLTQLSSAKDRKNNS